MVDDRIEGQQQTDLRLRARARLTGRTGPDTAAMGATQALGVLYELASSPTTAADALAVLHELQVHQVEMDLQAEELGSSRAELESALRRQIQLYDFAPVGCLTIDGRTAMHELNLAAAELLGTVRDALIGCRLDSLLAARSAGALHAMLERIGGASRVEAGELELLAPGGTARVVHARIRADPAGSRFLVAITDLPSLR